MKSVFCPYCQKSHQAILKKGFFYRSSRPHTVQRFYCRLCRRCFSSQTLSLTYKQKKPELNQPLFRLIDSGISQRRVAFIFSVKPITVARIIRRLAYGARLMQRYDLSRSKAVTNFIFDEMETFEHTKCKPLSIAVGVEEQSRKILSMRVCQMPAKGRLTHIALKKYGPRKDHRKRNLKRFFTEIHSNIIPNAVIKSDECPRYPAIVKEFFPNAIHNTYKGRRGCVVGQGELKAGGFDPLFSLNHTCAMVRDNIKRLSRRTWCTTKDSEKLQQLLDLYTVFHNQRLVNKKRAPVVEENLGPGAAMWVS